MNAQVEETMANKIMSRTGAMERIMLLGSSNAGANVGDKVSQSLELDVIQLASERCTGLRPTPAAP